MSDNLLIPNAAREIYTTSAAFAFQMRQWTDANEITPHWWATASCHACHQQLFTLTDNCASRDELAEKIMRVLERHTCFQEYRQ